MVSYAVAAFAFLLLSVLLILNWKRSAPGFWLIMAAGFSFLWAASVVLSASLFFEFTPVIQPLETLRTGAWLAFIISVLARLWHLHERANFTLIMAVAVNAILGLLLLVDLSIWFGWFPQLTELTDKLRGTYFMARLICAVGGLTLIENLYRDTPSSNRWGIRLLCLGLGAIFAYDIFLYADAMLFSGVNQDWYGARGVVNALAVPLIGISAARNPAWKLDLYLSRRIVFHTLSVLGTGIYLLLMAGAGYYLREFGGDWGTLLQISFLVAALLVLAVLAFSGRFRSQARVFFAKHFFNYRYDYREVWLRYIRTVSDASTELDLDRRVIQAVADMFDSPGGVLWLPDDMRDYRLAARWNYRTAYDGCEPAKGDFVRFLTQRQWVVDLNEMRDDGGDYQGLPVPAWAEDDPEAWLVIPLIHLERLIGFIVLQQPRAPRTLNWEDHDLLKTVGRQTASYLAEKQSQEALAEAQQFESFNRRFAFIMHDLKNLVSQQSLLVRNADKHAGNPEFQRDMLLTLKSSVDKMNDMLAKLREVTDVAKKDDKFVLKPLLEDVVKDKRQQHAPLSLNWKGEDVSLKGDRDRLEQVFTHLIQNAIDASAADAPIKLTADAGPQQVAIEIADRGAGMSEEFIRRELFKPFSSTKQTGFGIGAYEARELIKALGGKLQVMSKLGEGTIMTVLLPCEPAATAAAGENENTEMTG